MAKDPLFPEDLAERWKTTMQTLAQWRYNGRGPEYTKIGRTIFYALEDVKNFEKEMRRRHTAEKKKWWRF